MNPTLERRKLRLREVKPLAQGHTARRGAGMETKASSASSLGPGPFLPQDCVSGPLPAPVGPSLGPQYSVHPLMREQDSLGPGGENVVVVQPGVGHQLFCHCCPLKGAWDLPRADALLICIAPPTAS